MNFFESIPNTGSFCLLFTAFVIPSESLCRFIKAKRFPLNDKSGIKKDFANV